LTNDYNDLFSNLEGLNPPMLPVATGLFLISLKLSLLKYVQKATIVETSETEHSTANN